MTRGNSFTLAWRENEGKANFPILAFGDNAGIHQQRQNQESIKKGEKVQWQSPCLMNLACNIGKNTTKFL